MNVPVTPWDNPSSYAPDCFDQLASVEYYERRARHYRSEARKVRLQRVVRAFCIAAAVFAVVYFGGRELIGLVQ
jgi:hypothetical protein